MIQSVSAFPISDRWGAAFAPAARLANETSPAPSADGDAAGDTITLSSSARAASASGLEQLDEAAQKLVQQLKTRDRAVRAHEAAHLAAAGAYATSGPSYEYQRGPDGSNYAVGGEVQIDLSSVEGDPEATIRKMQIVRAAALAPADPSSQDRAVAAAASQKESQAAAELARQRIEDSRDGDASSGTSWLGQFFDVVA